MPQRGKKKSKEDRTEFPERLKEELPEHAQHIYEKALKNAYEESKDPDKRRGDADREETAHKVAWSAVKQQYEKGRDGKWHRKSGSGENE